MEVRDLYVTAEPTTKQSMNETYQTDSHVRLGH